VPGTPALAETGPDESQATSITGEKPSLRQQQPTEKNVLIFGNSFSHGGLRHLPKIAEARGDTANVVCLRGPFLEAIERELSPKPMISVEEAKKLGHGEANREGYVLLERKYSERAKAIETLKSRKWDIITLQSGSSGANRIDEDKDRYLKLASYAGKYAPDAEIVLYLTTQYRNDSLLYGTDVKVPLLFRESRGVKKDIPFTEDLHFFQAYRAHQRLAKIMKCRIIPGGTVFQNVRYAEKWPYERFPKPDFDYTNKEEKVVPQEKGLRYGMRFPGRDLRHPAGLTWWGDSHPHTLGEYLSGLAYYELVFEKSAVGCSYFPQSISQAEAEYLQQIVHETMRGRMPPLRLFTQQHVDEYNEILKANPNSETQSVSLDPEYNRMCLEIWEKYGKKRVRK